MSDEYRIGSVEELEAVVGEPLDFVKEKVEQSLDEAMVGYIRRTPLIFLATMDERGQPDVSPKGDAPGFVLVDDNGDLLIPDRPGNRLTYGFRNILKNSNIGVIFVVPGIRETLRVKGVASITRDPALLEQMAVHGKPAILCTRVQVQECFFHCGKAMIRSRAWKPDQWEQHSDSPMVTAMTKRLGGDEELEKFVTEEIEKNYRDELY